MKRAITQSRCSIVRECGNHQCLFKMLQNGYKLNPQNELERNRNTAIERHLGKGFYPKWTSVGKGEFADIICSDYIDRR